MERDIDETHKGFLVNLAVGMRMDIVFALGRIMDFGLKEKQIVVIYRNQRQSTDLESCPGFGNGMGHGKVRNTHAGPASEPNLAFQKSGSQKTRNENKQKLPSHNGDFGWKSITNIMT